MKTTSGKRLYSLKESYIIAYLAFRSFSRIKYAKKKGLINEQFSERIMLAVTEVNGCEVCSYAHTKMALEAGMSNEEIQKMLSGTQDDAPVEELPAIMFAQHYADTRSKYSCESWERIVDEYGLAKAHGILGYIRIIMMGNAYGVAWSSFVNRFKGKPDKRSNLLYELGMVFCTFIFIPVALIHAAFAMLFIRDKYKKDKEQTIS